MHLAVRAYVADLCQGCGWPKEYSTNPAAEDAWTAPPPTRCFACTAIEKRAAKHHKAEAPGALAYHAAPTEGLLAAMSDPALRVAPPLPTGVTGHVHATPAQLVQWLSHHGLPVPDELAHAQPDHGHAGEPHPILTT